MQGFREQVGVSLLVAGFKEKVVDSSFDSVDGGERKPQFPGDCIGGFKTYAANLS